MISILWASVTLDEFEKYGHPSIGGKLNFFYCILGVRDVYLHPKV